jgi:hypothetical protein
MTTYTPEYLINALAAKSNPVIDGFFYGYYDGEVYVLFTKDICAN